MRIGNAWQGSAWAVRSALLEWVRHDSARLITLLRVFRRVEIALFLSRPVRAWRFPLAFVFALAIAHGSLEARAEEFHSLREDAKNLNSIAEQQHILLPHPLPLLPDGIPFQKIAWDIVGLPDLIKYELVDLITDRQTLSTFIESTLRERVSELGVSAEIEVSNAPLDGLRSMPCDTLRLGFSFRVFEVPSASSQAIAVVVNLISWQGALIERPDGSLECPLNRVPTWAQLDNTKLFLVEPGNGDKMMAEAKRAILEIIDYSVLRRIARSNKSALDTIESWVR